MTRTRVIACLCTLMLIGIVGAAAQNQTQSPEESSYGALRRLAKNAKSEMSANETYQVSRELANYNVGIPLTRPGRADATILDRLAVVVAQSHLEWQRTGRQGIPAGKLLAALNRELDLDNHSDYLRLRADDLNRVRTMLWVQVPELVSVVDKKDRRADEPLFAMKLSPLEAFLATDLLLYQKLYNDTFVQTDEERKSNPAKERAPGLHVGPVNPRRLEFESHVKDVALRKWKSADDVLAAVAGILRDRQ
jgi:hypothetical protein